MDSPPASPSLRFYAGLGLVLAAFLVYGIFIGSHMGAYAGGSDSSGYMNNARLLAHGRAHMPQRILPGLDPRAFNDYAFIPLGFRPMSPTTMAPTYPIGLSLGIAALAQIVGWAAAPHVIMLLSALAAVGLMIPLARIAGLPWSWSCFGALLLAASPLTTFMSVQLMSDVPAMAAATATVVCAWRSRDRPGFAALAGAMLAFAVLIRPSNVLLIFPVAVCFGLNWRRWFWLGLAGLPGAAVQCYYNWRAYGHALESGYGELYTLFERAVVATTFWHYVHWLPILLTPIGVLVLALPFVQRGARLAWVLLTWIAAMLGFYLSYYHTHETWWYLRFVLPCFPAAIVGGLWVAHTLWERWNGPSHRSSRRGHLYATLCAAAALIYSFFWHNRLGAAGSSGESAYQEAIVWAKGHLPGNSTFLAMQTTGALIYYGNFDFVRWDMIDPEHFALVTRAAQQAGRPIYAMLFPYEEENALKKRLPGEWTFVQRVGQTSFWQWSGRGPTAPSQ